LKTKVPEGTSTSHHVRKVRTGELSELLVLAPKSQGRAGATQT